MRTGRTENLAHLFYDYLTAHLGQKFTFNELCFAVGITPRESVRPAIKLARTMATEAGYHFPPAVPANKHTYTITRLAEDALDPSIHMARIERGVRLRKEDGVEFMRRERSSLPGDLRPIVDMQLAVHDAAVKALGTIQAANDDMVVALMEARKKQRGSES